MNETDVKPELFDALRALAETVPDMRIGQLLAAAGEICADLHGRGLGDAEDAELVEAVWKFQKGIESNLHDEIRQGDI